LDFGGACDGVYDARKLNQHPIAGALDDTSLVLRDLRVEELLAMSIEGGKRRRLVGAHQTAEADHVCSQYCGKAAFHRVPQALKRRNILPRAPAKNEQPAKHPGYA
jgi:hypothetical protein